MESTHQNLPTRVEELGRGYTSEGSEPMSLNVEADSGVSLWDNDGDELPKDENSEASEGGSNVTIPDANPVFVEDNAWSVCDIPDDEETVDWEDKASETNSKLHDEIKLKIKKAFYICLAASKDHIERFRQNLEDHMPIEAGDSRNENDAMELYSQGGPTDSLSSNVIFVIKIARKPLTLTLTSDAILFNLRRIRTKLGEEVITQVHEDMLKNCEIFLRTLEDDKKLEELRNLKAE